MEMKVYFPGNKRVFADYKGFTIETDQPEHGGGDDTAPAPFDLFIASIGTCAGIFMLGFMQQRDISTEGAGITLRTERDPEAGLIGRIVLDLHLPSDFPEKYKAAVVNAVELCTVKRHMHQPPEFVVNASIV
ncbi:MAG: OsmC family protein [Actinobacteria bacterium]|nr:OsmC family protein [Actinomycetota bacterium]